MNQLSQMKCVACRPDAPKLSDEEIKELLSDVPQWEVQTENGVKTLVRKFSFKNYPGALAFTNRVGTAAEEEDHHPVIITEWGKVTVKWWTHTIGGLHKNDFIMAAKTDELYQG